MSGEQVRVRARYTGNKRVGYRWLGAVGGGKGSIALLGGCVKVAA